MIIWHNYSSKLIIQFPKFFDMGCGASNEEYMSSLNPDGSQERKNKKKAKKINDRFSVRNEIFQNVSVINKTVSVQELSLIDSSLCSHFLLYRLSKAERLALIQCFQGFSAQKGDYIFKQGDPASMFFIISKGRVAIQINGCQSKQMGSGQYFGELALLYSAPRSASIKALEDSKFWCLSNNSFKKTIQNMVKQNYQMAKTYMDKIPAFDFLSDTQKDAIAYNMHTLKYQQKETVFKEGDDANSFYVIVSGDIEIEIFGKKKIVLKAGDSFGENSFKEGEFRTGTATSLNQVRCLSIGRDAVKACLGGQFQQLRFFNIIKWALRRSKVLKDAPNNLIEKLIPFVQVKLTPRSQEILIREGQNIDSFIICLEGKVSGEYPGKVFFEDLVINKKLMCDQVLAVDEPGAIGVLSFSAIEDLLGGSLETHLCPNSFDQFRDEQQMKLTNLRPSLLGNQRLKLQDFNVVSKLGEGQFGKVYLVEKKQNNLIKYAIKCIEKNMIIKNSMEVFIQQERSIMVEINFPLIVQLQSTFKDQHFIYLLMEFIDGGDFFDILREIGLLNYHVARFYLGCLLVCIEYLHSKSIIYRDLKPENAVVSQDGYLHMIDLGTAKFLHKDNGFRTFTIIGTPHYMAPQIIEGKGYGFASDIWSLGIMTYEMVCGSLPYGQDLDDPYDIYKEIEQGDLQFPKSYKDIRGKQIIKRLMFRNPERRAVEKFLSLKKMSFFQGFSWESLLKKNMKPPYKPKKRNRKEKNFQNISFLSLIEKQKKTLGEPEKSTDPDWDNIFQTN